MGTNYYARMNHCGECDRHDEVHIGKKSGGWQFSFHGTDELRSWKDWQVELQKPGVRIFNEYDEELTFEQFKVMVEASMKEPHNLNHADECRRTPSDMYYAMSLWKDEEGYSFSPGEFS